jgi:hypothetical protein
VPDRAVNERNTLFRVLVADHEYLIYDNGDISGFSDGATVSNFFPHLQREYGERVRLQLQALTSRVGVAHTV